MEVVLIDAFLVPDDATEAFLAQSEQAQYLVSQIDGFVEGMIYEKVDGDSPYQVITVAVWESDFAFSTAKQIVKEAHQEQGFNPQDFMDGLNVLQVRSVYHRRPY